MAGSRRRPVPSGSAPSCVPPGGRTPRGPVPGGSAGPRSGSAPAKFRAGLRAESPPFRVNPPHHRPGLYGSETRCGATPLHPSARSDPPRAAARESASRVRTRSAGESGCRSREWMSLRKTCGTSVPGQKTSAPDWGSGATGSVGVTARRSGPARRAVRMPRRATPRTRAARSRPGRVEPPQVQARPSDLPRVSRLPAREPGPGWAGRAWVQPESESEPRPATGARFRSGAARPVPPKARPRRAAVRPSGWEAAAAPRAAGAALRVHNPGRVRAWPPAPTPAPAASWPAAPKAPASIRAGRAASRMGERRLRDSWPPAGSRPARPGPGSTRRPELGHSTVGATPPRRCRSRSGAE